MPIAIESDLATRFRNEQSLVLPCPWVVVIKRTFAQRVDLTRTSVKASVHYRDTDIRHLGRTRNVDRTGRGALVAADDTSVGCGVRSPPAAAARQQADYLLRCSKFLQRAKSDGRGSMLGMLGLPPDAASRGTECQLIRLCIAAGACPGSVALQGRWSYRRTQTLRRLCLAPAKGLWFGDVQPLLHDPRPRGRAAPVPRRPQSGCCLLAS